jgi:hypothetical protein
MRVTGEDPSVFLHCEVSALFVGSNVQIALSIVADAPVACEKELSPVFEGELPGGVWVVPPRTA